MRDRPRTGAAATGTEAEVRRLGRPGRFLRLGAGAAALGTLLYGSAWGTDDMFPLGPMVQFAFAVDLDGEIRSTFVEARTTDGELVRVPLTADGIGYLRAELEGRIPTFRKRPETLQALAVAQRRRHPDRAQYTHLWLRQEVTDLRDGEPTGRREELLAEWAVVLDEDGRPWDGPVAELAAEPAGPAEPADRDPA